MNPTLIFENQNNLSKLISSFLILAFLVSSFYLIFLPQPASAKSVLGNIFKPITEAIVWVIKSVLIPLVQAVLLPLLQGIMSFINTPLKIAGQASANEDFATRILTIAIAGVTELVVFAALIDGLKIALTAIFVDTSLAESLDKGITQIISGLIIDFIIAEVTNEVIKTIQGGGNPQFVQDWGAFSKNLADKVGGALLSQITSGYIDVCSAFSPQLKLALAPIPEFRTQAKCTLTDITKNITKFGENFENGGWLNWIQIINNPENTLTGSYVLTQDELNRRLAKQGEASKNEAISGKGFIGVKRCTDSAGQPIATSLVRDMDAEQIKEAGYTCKIVTPGDVIAGFSNKISTGLLDKLQSISGNLFGIDPKADTMWAKIVPFITAIIGSAMNEIVKEGLSEVKKEVSQADFVQDNSASAGVITAPSFLTLQIQGDISAAQSLQAILPTLAEQVNDDLILVIQNNINILTNIQTLQKNTLSNMTANLIYDSTNLRETLKTGFNTPDTTCSIPQALRSSTTDTTVTPARTIDNKDFTPTEIGLANVDKTTTSTVAYSLVFSFLQIKPKYDAALVVLSAARAQYNTATDPATNILINDFVSAATIYSTDTKNTTSKINYETKRDALIAKILTITQTKSNTLSDLNKDIQFLNDFGITQQIAAINGEITPNTAQCTLLTGTTTCDTISARSLKDLVCH